MRRPIFRQNNFRRRFKISCFSFEEKLSFLPSVSLIFLPTLCSVPLLPIDLTDRISTPDTIIQVHLSNHPLCSALFVLAIPEIRGISVPFPLYTRLRDSLFSLLLLPLFSLSSHSPATQEKRESQKWPRNLMISNELSHHSFVP